MCPFLRLVVSLHRRAALSHTPTPTCYLTHPLQQFLPPTVFPSLFCVLFLCFTPYSVRVPPPPLRDREGPHDPFCPFDSHLIFSMIFVAPFFFCPLFVVSRVSLQRLWAGSGPPIDPCGGRVFPAPFFLRLPRSSARLLSCLDSPQVRASLFAQRQFVPARRQADRFPRLIGLPKRPIGRTRNCASPLPPRETNTPLFLFSSPPGPSRPTHPWGLLGQCDASRRPKRSPLCLSSPILQIPLVFFVLSKSIVRATLPTWYC